MSRSRHLDYIMLSVAFLALGTVSAVAQQIVDNWNTAACGFTDTVTLRLRRPARVSRIDVWYYWGPNETMVPYTISAGGRMIGSGNFARAECDPYQTSWCVARDEPQANLAAGRYILRIASAKLCQNPESGGRGFIRAYGSPF